MKILVTGAGGFLGSRCAEELKRAGHTVIAPSHAQCDWTEDRQAAALLARLGYRKVKNIGGIAAYQGKVVR